MNILARLDKEKITTETLDEVVHEAAADMASNANNEGVGGQVDFLITVAKWSEKDILEALSLKEEEN